MKKLKLSEMWNWGSENLIKLRPEKNSPEAPLLMDALLRELGFKSYFSEIHYPDRKDDSVPEKVAYKDIVNKHEFFANKHYAVHVIAAERYLYFIIRTPLSNRKKMLKKLMKYCRWAKGAK